MCSRLQSTAGSVMGGQANDLSSVRGPSPLVKAPPLPLFQSPKYGATFLCRGRSRGARNKAPTTTQAAVDGGLYQVVAVETRRRFRFWVCFEDGTNRSF